MRNFAPNSFPLDPLTTYQLINDLCLCGPQTSIPHWPEILFTLYGPCCSCQCAYWSCGLSWEIDPCGHMAAFLDPLRHLFSIWRSRFLTPSDARGAERAPQTAENEQTKYVAQRNLVIEEESKLLRNPSHQIVLVFKDQCSNWIARVASITIV